MKAREQQPLFDPPDRPLVVRRALDRRGGYAFGLAHPPNRDVDGYVTVHPPSEPGGRAVVLETPPTQRRMNDRHVSAAWTRVLQEARMYEKVISISGPLRDAPRLRRKT